MQPTFTLYELQDSPPAGQTTTAPSAAPAGPPSASPAATSASTETTPPAESPGFMGSIGSFLPLIAIFAVFYFVLIGPERKARKKREGMLRELKKGDKVLTTSGMYASVVAIHEDEVTLQIADDVRARFTRAAVQSVVSTDASDSSKKS